MGFTPRAVAELTGRGVVAMMSANHLAPDLAAEIYVLDGPPRPCRWRRVSGRSSAG